jgi:hypothetical protein
VANIVEVLDVAPEEEEEEDGATVDLDAQRKGGRLQGARGRIPCARRPRGGGGGDAKEGGGAGGRARPMQTQGPAPRLACAWTRRPSSRPGGPDKRHPALPSGPQASASC